jgi:hypothetical protein
MRSPRGKNGGSSSGAVVLDVEVSAVVSTLPRGRGSAITNEALYGEQGVEEERREYRLEDPSILAIKGLGQFREFRVVAELRSLIENWHISDFHIRDARPSSKHGTSEIPQRLRPPSLGPLLLDWRARRATCDPDAIAQPSCALVEVVAEYQKISGARRMAQLLARENGSRSFRAFVAAVERICAFPDP